MSDNPCNAKLLNETYGVSKWSHRYILSASWTVAKGISDYHSSNKLVELQAEMYFGVTEADYFIVSSNSGLGVQTAFRSGHTSGTMYAVHENQQGCDDIGDDIFRPSANHSGI